jgi:hypothetical protein
MSQLAPRTQLRDSNTPLRSAPRRRDVPGEDKPYVTHQLPLERSAEAIRLLTDRKAHGKVVVVPGLAG